MLGLASGSRYHLPRFANGLKTSSAVLPCFRFAFARSFQARYRDSASVTKTCGFEHQERMHTLIRTPSLSVDEIQMRHAHRWNNPCVESLRPVRPDRAAPAPWRE